MVEDLKDLLHACLVIVEKKKNNVQSNRELFQFHGISCSKKYEHEGTKVGIHLRAIVHGIGFSY
jgi:hypothetical protein